MVQLAVFIAGLLLTRESQASNVAEGDPSIVQGFLSKMEKKQTFNGDQFASFGHTSDAMQRLGGFVGSEKFIVPTFSNVNYENGPHAFSHQNSLAEHDGKPASGKPAIATIKEEERAAQKLLPNGNSTPMTLYAVGVGLFALVMMLRVRIRRRLRPATVLASNGGLVSDMSDKMVPGLSDNVLEMKSHASSSINGATLGDLAWNPLNLLPSDPTIGWQPAVFFVAPQAYPACRTASTHRAAAADPFSDNRAPIVLYDGVCRMCNFWVDWVLDNDPTAKLRFAALQSPAGRRLLERSGRSPDDISSIVLVTPEKAFIKSEAVLEIGKQLSVTTPLATIASGVVPRAIADAAYDTIANNRYNIAGKRSYRDSDARLAERFLSDDE